MQKPTDLASLRDFSEWKKDCDVKVGALQCYKQDPLGFEPLEVVVVII